jgi:transcriptional regulator with XRE-family HTH domain
MKARPASRALPPSAVGRRIRELRLERQLTQTELARQIGIQQSDLSRMEKGEYRVPLDVLFRILRSFDVSLNAFFGESRNQLELTEQETLLVQSFRELSPEARREVEEYVEFKRSRETRTDEV